MGPSGQRVRAFPAARWQRAQVTTPVVRGRPRVVDRGVSPTGWSVVIVDHPGAAGPGRAVEVDDVGRRGGACLLLPGVGGGDGDEVLGAAAEDVADRGDELQGDAFGALVDQPVDLGAGELDAAFGEQGDQVGGAVQAAGGHQLGQAPGVVDGAPHEGTPGVPTASPTVRSSAALRVALLKSELTNW